MKDTVVGIRCELGDALFTLYEVRLSMGKMPKKICHSHVYYEVHIVHDGMKKLNFENGSVTLKKGDLFIIPPGVEHDLSLVGDGCDWCVFAFSLAKTDNSPSVYHTVSNALQTSALKIINCNAELATLSKSFLKSSIDFSLKEYCKAKTDASKIIYMLLENIGAFEDSDNVYTIDSDTLVLLDNLINSGFALKEIAERINYSERQTLRIIKNVYGKTLSSMRTSKTKE